MSKDVPARDAVRNSNCRQQRQRQVSKGATANRGSMIMKNSNFGAELSINSFELFDVVFLCNQIGAYFESLIRKQLTLTIKVRSFVKLS